LRLHSWNVNGLRAAIKKGFFDYLRDEDPDILCLQEIKALPEQVEHSFDGYHIFWNSAQRKGYSGTMTLTKKEPISVRRGIGVEVFDIEGRVLTLEFEDFFLVNIYTPNAKRGLERLDERMVFEEELKSFLASLADVKHVIVCGDLNVAHKEIDLKNPEANRRNAGFTDEEREKFTLLLESGFIDTFRHFYPDATDVYSWWSQITRARSRNAGWRIDYFLVSDGMKEMIKDARVRMEIMGSDHCPVELELL
jgi:exodeoxyribonuclease-3